jgi:hypothetical protein
MNLPDKKTKVVILALNTGHNKEMETKWIKHDTGLESKPVIECYKGQTEVSHVVPYETKEQFELLVALAKDHKQESILVLLESRQAALHYVNTRTTVPIGRLVNATEQEALNSENYTYDPIYREYYVTKEN